MSSPQMPSILSFDNVVHLPDMSEELSQGLLIDHFIEIVQSRSDRHTRGGVQQAGKIYVGTDDLSSGWYVADLHFLLVHAQTITYPRHDGGRLSFATVGARRYRTHKPARGGRGWERDQSEEGRTTRWCASSNGLMPRANYIGKDVVDIRTDEVHRIGYRKVGDHYVPVGFNMNPDGTLVENPHDYVDVNGSRVLNICGACPFSKRLSSDDKSRTPCEDAKRFVVYVLPKEGYWDRGFLATIMNSNGGVANALNGAPAKYFTARSDGAALRGIVSLFSRERNNIKRDVLPVDLTESMSRFVVSYTSASDGKVVSARNMPYQEMVGLVDAGTVSHWTLELPTYKNAPEGLPEMVGRLVRVHPAIMRVADNAYTPPTKVPDMNIDASRVITEEEYADYLAARFKYYNDGVFSAMMRLSEMVESTQAHVSAHLAPSTSVGQLGVGDLTSDSDPLDLSF